MNRTEDGALGDALAGLVGQLRRRSWEALDVSADRFEGRLADHLRYAEETLFPARRKMEPATVHDVEELKGDHRRLRLYARDLALQIRRGDKEGALGVARAFLAALLDHLHRETEGWEARRLRGAVAERRLLAMNPCVDMGEPLKRYPREIAGSVRIRPPEASDESALLSYFKRIPVDERQLFKDDVTQLAILRGRLGRLDDANIFSLLAFDGPRIVADATLHWDRRGWARHVARIRVTLDPDYRRRGLARALVREFVDLAEIIGIAILQAEVLDVQKEAHLLFEDLGFQVTATLPQHAIDLSGRVHDILIHTLTVTPPDQLAPEARWAEADADIGGG